MIRKSLAIVVLCASGLFADMMGGIAGSASSGYIEGTINTVSTYTVITSSYPINVNASFSPPAVQNVYTLNPTTVTFSNQAQQVTSSYTVVTDTYALPVAIIGSISNTGFNVNNSVGVTGTFWQTTQPTYTTNLATITFNGITQPVTLTSTFVYVTNPATVTFSGQGAQPIVSTSVIGMALVSSITLPSPLTDATTSSVLIDSIRRQIVADVPVEVISTTASATASSVATEYVLISSAPATQRTIMCGCVFQSTQVATGYTIYQSTSAKATNPFYSMQVPTTVGFNNRTDCGHPFFWSAQGGAITIKPNNVVAGSSWMTCQYIQK